jgi:hypothetical protein
MAKIGRETARTAGVKAGVYAMPVASRARLSDQRWMAELGATHQGRLLAVRQ